jgi:hypothetical protein
MCSNQGRLGNPLESVTALLGSQQQRVFDKS